MINMRCIYCDSPGPFDSEHILPRCFGTFEGEQHLENRVCKCCNNLLGNTVDLHLCRSGPEAFFRHYLRIKGRKHHGEFSPYESGPAGRPAAAVMIPYPGKDFMALWELEPGTHNVHLMRQVIVKDKQGEWHPVHVRDSIRTPEALLTLVSSIMDGKAVEVNVFWEAGKEDWLPELVKETYSFSSFNSEKAEMGGFNARASIKLTARPEYFRGIAKVAFNYFLQQDSSINGDEPAFDAIRSFIKDGGNIDRFVRQTSDVLVDVPPGMWFSQYGHILSVARVDGHIRAWVAFIVGPQFPGNKYYVEIGRHPSRILLPRPQLHGHYYHYFEEPTSGHTGGIECLTPGKIILPIGRTPGS